MKHITSFLFAALLSVATIPPANALTVFDPSNYAQNVLQAARALEQINNQIRAIQNQVQMIRNMQKNLERLDFSSIEDINRSLRRIDSLIHQAERLGFDLDALDEQWREHYPETYDAAIEIDDLAQEAKERWRSAMEAHRQAMRVQSGIAETIQEDARLLEDLVGESQGAVGALQAQQATAQLIALSAKQAMQIQSLLAAQFRAESVEKARKAQMEEAARKATDDFLEVNRFGNGN